MAQNLTDLLRKFADDVRPYVDATGHFSVTVRKDKSIDLGVHDSGTYAESIALMKRLGATLNNTAFFDAHNPWTAVRCKLQEIELTLYSSGLPPTCEIVSKTVSVPKTQTVDTGDMIEITTQEIRCLNTEEDA